MQKLRLTATQIKTLTYIYTNKEVERTTISHSGLSTRPLELLYSHGLVGLRDNFGTQMVSITNKGILLINKMKELTQIATQHGIPDKYRNKDRLIERLSRDAAVLLNIK